jgi:phosphoenolpyruvate carboxykinase (GTP)
VDTPIGRLPAEGSLETEGLDVSPEALAELTRFDPEAWSAQLPQVRDHLAQFGDRLPQELRDQLDALERGVTS